jgi:2-polyprenyl-6-methoxyphenol hydroxylase-like FAD-dependent oxidoreductase
MRSKFTACDVLVVGAGPAGLTTAIMLARHGIDVLVVERHENISSLPKATSITTRTMELLRTWGIEQQVRAGAMRVRPVLTVSRTLIDPRQIDAPFGYPSDEAALAVSPTTPCYCSQDYLEPELREHLRAHGGRIRFGTELTDFTTDDAGVSAVLRDRTSGRPKEIRTRYLIGADGLRSTVRTSLGIGLDDFGTLGEYVAVTFRADLTRYLPRLPAVINLVEIADAAGLFLPTSTNDQWIYGRERHSERGESLTNWTPQRCLELLRAGTGLRELCPGIVAITPFTMVGQVATAFRVGRTFLVGDAAHRTTPIGGAGMNIAIHSAHNLGWKLAWVLRGWADQALLDSYEAERRPIGIQNVLRTLRQEIKFEGDALAWDIGVRYASTVIKPGPGTGERAPHAWVRCSGSRVSTLDLFDGRLTVLTGPQGEPWRQAVTELAAEGLPILAWSDTHDLYDEDGAFAQHYRLGEVGAALVRPDGYLAWSSSEAAGDARAVLRSAVALALGRADAPATMSSQASPPKE